MRESKETLAAYNADPKQCLERLDIDAKELKTRVHNLCETLGLYENRWARRRFDEVFNHTVSRIGASPHIIGVFSQTPLTLSVWSHCHGSSMHLIDALIQPDIRKTLWHREVSDISPADIDLLRNRPKITLSAPIELIIICTLVRMIRGLPDMHCIPEIDATSVPTIIKFVPALSRNVPSPDSQTWAHPFGGRRTGKALLFAKRF